MRTISINYSNHGPDAFECGVPSNITIGDAKLKIYIYILRKILAGDAAEL